MAIEKSVSNDPVLPSKNKHTNHKLALVTTQGKPQKVFCQVIHTHIMHKMIYDKAHVDKVKELYFYVHSELKSIAG